MCGRLLVVGGCPGEGLSKPNPAWIDLGAAVAAGNGARTGLSVEEKWCRAANSLQLLLKGNPGIRDTPRGVACPKTTGLMPVGHVGAPVAPLCLFRAISFRSSFLLTYCQCRSADSALSKPLGSPHSLAVHRSYQKRCTRGTHRIFFFLE